MNDNNPNSPNQTAPSATSPATDINPAPSQDTTPASFAPSQNAPADLNTSFASAPAPTDTFASNSSLSNGIADPLNPSPVSFSPDGSSSVNSSTFPPSTGNALQPTQLSDLNTPQPSMNTTTIPSDSTSPTIFPSQPDTNALGQTNELNTSMWGNPQANQTPAPEQSAGSVTPAGLDLNTMVQTPAPDNMITNPAAATPAAPSFNPTPSAGTDMSAPPSNMSTFDPYGTNTNTAANPSATAQPSFSTPSEQPAAGSINSTVSTDPNAQPAENPGNLQNPQNAPMPTFLNQQAPESTAPAEQTAPVGDQSAMQPPPPPESTEPAPTDLSQLTGVNDQPPPEVYTPPVSSPENLVIPQPQSTIPETLNNNDHKGGLSKVLIIAGVVIILLVAAASAYFILGIGKTSAPATASTPAKQAPLTNPPQQPSQTTPAPVTQATPTASGSATFGSLNSGTTAVSPSPSSTSALEMLRSRKQATPTPAASATPQPSNAPAAPPAINQ